MPVQDQPGVDTMGNDEQGSTAFSLGKGARIGKLEVGGHVAGRDAVVGATPPQAASAQDLQQVLDILKRLQEQTAALQVAAAGPREDAQDELRKAHDAAAQGDVGRLVEKLGAAQGYLERIGQSVPAALTLAQTVATIVLRVHGLD